MREAPRRELPVEDFEVGSLAASQILQLSKSISLSLSLSSSSSSSSLFLKILSNSSFALAV